MADTEVVSAPGTAGQTPIIIGIGSSAGGLEALRALASGLPDNIGCAYVVVQHMSPQHKSLMRSLIDRETALEVVDIEDGAAPQPDTIHVTPPRHDVVIRDGVLRLMPASTDAAKPKPSVDRFLLSLAEEMGERAVAVILSGTGSDGAYGVKAIREAGGITIAQDDASAKYDGMPNAAIRTGCIDLVLQPDQIATHLRKILQSAGNLEAFQEGSGATSALAGLLQIVLARTRVDFREYKMTTIQRRVERRMTAMGCASSADYVTLCRNSPREIDALFKDLLISVTRFFRDSAEFESFAAAIRKLVQRKPQGPLRIWVAGCATGEEVYSIAILLAEAMGGAAALAASNTQIFATDIDRDALETARCGEYSQGALIDVPEDLVEGYFSQTPDGVRVVDALRSAVIFSDHNLCQDPPFMNMDLICCRNVMIYFGPKLQAKVLTRFHYAMGPEALLFLGTAETVAEAGHLFVPAGDQGQIFRKTAARRTKPYDPAALAGTWARPGAAGFGQSPGRSDPHRPGDDLFDGLARSLATDAVLVGADLGFRKIYGDISAYVTVAEGAGLSLEMALLKPPLRDEARSLVTLALKHGERRISSRLERGPAGGALLMEAIPILSRQSGERFALLTFTPQAPVEAPSQTPGQTPGEADTAPAGLPARAGAAPRDVDLELSDVREALQVTIEALETSNQELQALNEELQSTNEELQATNEELETSNEELQSTNEELITVNQELQVNSAELKALNAELGSVLENVPIPLLVLDTACQIVRASRAAIELFKIADPSVTPHLSQIALPYGFPRLMEICNTAMQTQMTVNRGFSSLGSGFELQCAPFLGESGQVIGTTLVFFQNPAMQSLSREITQMLDYAPVHLIRYTEDGVVVRISAITASALGLTRQEAVGRTLPELLRTSAARDGGEDLQLILRGEKADGLLPLAADAVTPPLWVSAQKFRYHDPAEDTDYNVLVGADVSAIIDKERILTIQNESLELIQDISRIGYWRIDLPEQTLHWSDKVFEIYGLDPASFTPDLDTALEAFHPDDREAARQVINTGLRDRTGWKLRCRLVHARGHIIWVDYVAEVITDTHGQSTAIVGSFRDVSNAQRYERMFYQIEALRNERGLGFFSVDILTKTTYWSPNIYRLLNIENTGADVFDTVVEMLVPEDRDRFNDLRDTAITAGDGFDGDFRITRPGHAEARLNVSMKTTTDQQGDTTDYFGVLKILES
ncbi:MAG: PAS domain-containing protein [Paracoccaceae bacterium]